MASNKPAPEQWESSRGVERPSTTQSAHVSPTSKKRKKKQDVAIKDQFDSSKFIAPHL